MASLPADVAVSYPVMAHDRDEARASRRELEHLLCEDLPDDPEQRHRTLTRITSRLRAALGPAVSVDGADLVVSASTGVTTARDAPDADALLHDGD